MHSDFHHLSQCTSCCHHYCDSACTCSVNCMHCCWSFLATKLGQCRYYTHFAGNFVNLTVSPHQVGVHCSFQFLPNFTLSSTNISKQICNIIYLGNNVNIFACIHFGGFSVAPSISTSSQSLISIVLFLKKETSKQIFICRSLFSLSY